MISVHNFTSILAFVPFAINVCLLNLLRCHRTFFLRLLHSLCSNPGRQTEKVLLNNGCNSRKKKSLLIWQWQQPCIRVLTFCFITLLYVEVKLFLHSLKILHLIKYDLTDIDECQMRVAVCDQLCQDTEGSYICSCHSGFTLSSNGMSCNGMRCAPFTTI